MVMTDDIQQSRVHSLLTGKHVVADDRMGPHDRHFGSGEFARLVQDFKGNARFSDVVNKSGFGKEALAFEGISELYRKRRAKPGDQQAVLVGNVIIAPNNIEPGSDVRMPDCGDDSLTAVLHRRCRNGLS